MWEYIVKSYRLFRSVQMHTKDVFLSVYCFCPCKFLTEYAIIVVQQHKKTLKKEPLPTTWHLAAAEKKMGTVFALCGGTSLHLPLSLLPPSLFPSHSLLSDVDWIRLERGGAETEASLMKMTMLLPCLVIEMHKLASFPRKTQAYVTCKKYRRQRKTDLWMWHGPEQV